MLDLICVMSSVDRESGVEDPEGETCIHIFYIAIVNTPSGVLRSVQLPGFMYVHKLPLF
jgi:hypothetical protein